MKVGLGESDISGQLSRSGKVGVNLRSGQQRELSVRVLPLYIMGDLEFALDLMRRLPPANVEQNLYNLCDMVPDMMSDLLGSVDQPLKIAHDSKHRKDYLLCDYNRDGDSYRYVLRGEGP